jgi:hypothetical protein
VAEQAMPAGDLRPYPRGSSVGEEDAHADILLAAVRFDFFRLV